MNDTMTSKKSQKGGLDTMQLLDLMSDIHGQPNWRAMANRAWAYYDGDQLPSAVKSTLQERGQPLTALNAGVHRFVHRRPPIARSVSASIWETTLKTCRRAPL